MNKLILCPDDRTKSGYIEKEIEKIIDNKPIPQNTNEKIYIIVPEQYTLETEKRFLMLLGERAMPYLKIVSFKHLARIVFAETGSTDMKFIDNGGKNALLLKAVSSVSPFLKHYPPDYKPISFIKLVGRAITDMKLGGLTPEELKKTAELENNGKLYDISLFASAYDALLTDGKIDANDSLSCLADILNKSKFLQKTTVYLDRFCTFTYAEKQVIFSLFQTGADITVTLPCPSLLTPPYSLFSEISRCASSVVAGAKKCGTEIEIIQIKSEKHRTDALEETAEKLYGEEETDILPEGISIYKASDINDEINRIASIITESVRDFGYRYKDFVIITRENDSYSSVLDPIFAKYNIPLFCHKRVPLKIKPISRLVDSLFAMATDGFRREYVMGFLKTGLNDFSTDDISLFETYTEKWRLSFDKFKSPFTLVPDTAYKMSVEETLARINEIRKKTVESAITFNNESEKDGKRTVLSIATALYGFFESINLEQRIADDVPRYIEQGEASLGAEQKQIYEIYIQALDELVTSAGNDEVTLDEFKQLLFTVVEEHDIGIIPTSLDEVMAGGIESVPLNSPKVAFVLGLSDGLFPKNTSGQSLFSDSDKILLEKKDIELGRTDEQMLLYEQFLVYRAFTAPTEKLYLSFSTGSSGQNTLSSALSEMLRLFPTLKVSSAPQKYDNDAICERIQNNSSAFEAYAKYNSPTIKKYLETTDFANYLTTNEETTIEKETAAKLFGKDISLSATKAARYGACRFSYFCEFGLGLQRKNKKVLGSPEMGTYIHEVLEKVISEGLDREESEIRESAEAFSKEYLKNVFGENELPAGFSVHFKRLVDKSVRLLMMFKEELEQSKFIPALFEANINDDGDIKPIVIPLEEGSIRLVGIADRIDTYEKDGRKYVRVIDYKSNGKDFDLQNVYYGLDIQMLMYLYAIKENGYPILGKTDTAGCMYIGVNPKTVRLEKNDSIENIQEEQLKKLKRSGIFLADNDVLNAMDDGICGKYINVKDGKKNNPLVSEEQFGKLFLHIRKILTDMGESILNGETYKNPIKSHNGDTCQYCIYKPYCVNDGKGRTLEQITFENIFNKIDGKEDGNGTVDT